MKGTFRFVGRDVRDLVRDLRSIEQRALMWIDSDLPPCLQLAIEDSADGPTATLTSNARTAFGALVSLEEPIPEGGFTAIVPIDVLREVRDGDAVLIETDGHTLVLRREAA